MFSLLIIIPLVVFLSFCFFFCFTQSVSIINYILYMCNLPGTLLINVPDK